MRCFIIGNPTIREIEQANATNPSKQIGVITLTDGRKVVNADILGDPYWSDYQTVINKLTPVEIDDLLFPSAKFTFLCSRDSRSIVTPEDGYTWWQYYVSTGELPSV